MKRIAKKVLLIGWDAADWKFLSPLMDKGLMPNLSKLVEEGVSGKLATLDPPLSPTLWTSIATGKRPFKHGIHGFTEVDPSGKNIRPIYITNRKVKAIWNMLDQHHLKSNVVGWWPSHPAEEINGVMISDFYTRVEHQPDHWPLTKSSVYPQEFEELLSSFRVHPSELTAAHIQPFVPDLWKAGPRHQSRLASLAKITAQASSIQAAITYLLEHTDWDFSAVYFDAIDHYCHGFMKFHPPRRPHVVQDDYDFFKGVVNGACRYHDMMLGRLLELAGEDTTIILLSDHGFHPDHNRPVFIPNEPSGPAIEHSPYGIIVMKGPGIKRDELIFGSSLLDITPTLLSLFGLPVGEDMDGKVLTQAFIDQQEIESIKSWEYGGGVPVAVTESPDAAMAAAELQQLVDLGYIEDFGDDRELAVKRTRDENNFYLARSYINGGEWKHGIKLLVALHQDNPQTLRYASHLADAYLKTGAFKESRKIIDHIKETADRYDVQHDILEATLLLAENRNKKALQLLRKVAQEAGNNYQIQLRLASAYLQLKELEDAEDALMSALKSDPEEVRAWHYLSVVYFEQAKYESAKDAALSAIGLLYHYPMAHYYLGRALEAMGSYEDAITAYDTCLRITPNFNEVRKRIINILVHELEEPGRAFKYQTDFENKIKGELIIVSGLPRSGTSMMMQMLDAAGLRLFTDKERSADDNNPKGYYEHELVKSLTKNKQWVLDANGKVVKVIAHLLPHLPSAFKYKVIFMDRNVHEVVQSQQRMLARNGKQVDESTLPLHLVEGYRNTLAELDHWITQQPNVEIIKVDYAATVAAPFLEAIKVREFLGMDLPIEKMVAAVDGDLYRERVKPLP